MKATAEQLAPLERVRDQLAAIEAEIAEIESGPLPAEHAAARLVERIREQASYARTRLGYFAAPGPLPSIESLAELRALLELVGQPKQLENAALEAFRQISAGDALPLEARPAAIEPLKAERDKLLITEERLIRALERDGIDVERRSEIDAAVLLAAWEGE